MSRIVSGLTALQGWIDARFPFTAQWKAHASEYYAPKNFNFWYYFGALSGLVLVNQIATGIFLTMHYKPDALLAFTSVEYIMRDVPWGWLIRYMHSTGASLFFVCIYLHMFRGLLYGSYRKPRELVWILGMAIFLCLMGEAFFGYLLPWGQMSYWGAQVIINLFDALPIIGHELSIWIRGDYVVSDATLNRFFAFHVIALPLLLFGLVGAHILALHEVGSNNPDGIEIKKHKDPVTHIPLDGIPFHPYYTVKDFFGAMVFMLIFAIIVFFGPEMGGYFLEANNFIPADSLKTPPEISPVWYFTPYYSILRSITTDFMWIIRAAILVMTIAIFWSVRKNWIRWGTLVIALGLAFLSVVLDPKVWGVGLMGTSTMIFFLMPWLDQSAVKSIRYKGPNYKFAITVWVIAFLILGYLGTKPVSDTRTLIGQFCTMLYFAFFFAMPWYTRADKSKPEPERVTWK
jgi:ubiquinol-cytochrome c reductase cytochrome b subunit